MRCFFPAVSQAFEDALQNFAAALFQRPSSSPPDDPLMLRAREFVWQLERAYEAATQGKPISELLAQFDHLLPSVDESRKVIIAWVDLIETLVQEAEREYGRRPHRGQYKAQQVKAIIIHLFLDRPVLKLKGLLGIAAPFAIEMAASWSIDAVVMLLNHNDACWVPAPETGSEGIVMSAPARWIQAIARWLQKNPFILYMAAFLQSLARRMVLAAHPLDTKLEAQLAAIERADLPLVSSLGPRIVSLGVWIGDHHDQVVGLVQLVSTAVHEAEMFVEMSGSEKKAYARDLVFALLEQYGFIRDDTPLSNFVTSWLVDWGIDSVVMIFNKRKLFTHKSDKGAVAATGKITVGKVA